MPKRKLSVPIVNALPASGDRPTTFYYDTETKGFGVRVCRRSKSYFVEDRPKGAEHRICVTLGRVDKITLDQARSLAKSKMGEMANGAKPLSPDKEARQQRRAAQAAAEAEAAERARVKAEAEAAERARQEAEAAKAPARAEAEAAERTKIPMLRRHSTIISGFTKTFAR